MIVTFQGSCERRAPIPAVRNSPRQAANSSRLLASSRFPNPLQLSDMETPVHQVKLSPLRAAERSEYRVIEQSCLLAEFFLRPRNRSVHGRDLCGDLAKHLLWGHSLRRGVRWSLTSFRQLPEADDVERARTILECRCSCQWFSGCQT